MLGENDQELNPVPPQEQLSACPQCGFEMDLAPPPEASMTVEVADLEALTPSMGEIEWPQESEEEVKRRARARSATRSAIMNRVNQVGSVRWSELREIQRSNQLERDELALTLGAMRDEGMISYKNFKFVLAEGA